VIGGFHAVLRICDLKNQKVMLQLGTFCRSAFLIFASFLILSSCGTDPGGGSDGGADGSEVDGGGSPQEFLIATFNVHLFFDDLCDSGACTSVDFEQIVPTNEFRRRALEVAQAIRMLSVDAVALQEIENQRAFDAIAVALQETMPYAAFGESGGAGSLDVAVLSKLPILGIRRHRSRPLVRPDGTRTTFTREFLEVHLELRNERAILFAAHFRSKWQDDPGRRAAEGQGAGEILSETHLAFPNAAIILAGDLNDVPASPPLNALESSTGALRVATELGDGANTYSYQGAGYALDHLYLVPTPGVHYVVGSVRVLRGAGAGQGYAGSDHAAMTAAFIVDG